ncbi:MAG: hypothetical protein HY231_26295 [Acidobacteria bacterium]|nr:hypothetical protein [Acidobacteriota bacterium]
MGQQVRIAIKGRDPFWAHAFQVEWQDQFPERALRADAAGFFSAAEEWLNDVERVAAQTFCQVIRAPKDPRRRAWLNSLIPNRDKKW